MVYFCNRRQKAAREKRRLEQQTKAERGVGEGQEPRGEEVIFESQDGLPLPTTE